MTTTVPFKTQLGQDELRSRAHKLGQRHRTLLFLIDGRRPLAEVLSLALQAGAATNHFEDLLRLGLVELPPDPAPRPEPPLPENARDAALTSVELVVPAEAEAAVTVAAPLIVEVIDEPAPPARPEPVEAVRDAVPLAPAVLEAAELPVQAPVHIDERDDAPAPAPPRAIEQVKRRPRVPPALSEVAAAPIVPREPAPEVPTVIDAPRQPLLRPRREVPTLSVVTSVPQREPVLPVLRAVHEAVGVPPAPGGAAAAGIDIDLPLPDQHESRLLKQVRELLTDTLRIDAPLFSARTFVRVRSAQSVHELIELVWEIQDHLSAKRHSRRELQSLQRARELLGLGNTLVDEDSRTDYGD